MENKMRGILIIAVCIILFKTSNGLTKMQIRNTGKAIRNVCQPRNNVSDELIQNINNGEFIEDQNVKCYIACVMKMARTMKNGKLDYTAAIRQIDLLFPEDLKNSAKKAIENCKDIPEEYEDICDAAFNTAKCIYKSNPNSFFFP